MLARARPAGAEAVLDAEEGRVAAADDLRFVHRQKAAGAGIEALVRMGAAVHIGKDRAILPYKDNIASCLAASKREASRARIVEIVERAD